MLQSQCVRVFKSTAGRLTVLLLCGAGVMGQQCSPLTDLVPGAATGPNDSGLTGKYVGAERCRVCHTPLHDKWADTRHAKAMETLEAIGQDTNSACLACHTVGFGKDGGYVDRATTESLVGVQCENCHGPGLDHVEDVGDLSKRPPLNISAAVCGECHNGEHHPTFDEWSASGHGSIDEHVVEYFADGRFLTNCGQCHSGDYRQTALIAGGTATDADLLGKTAEEMNAVVCATCHDPHEQTGNAFLPDAGHDIQLRYPEIAFPTPSSTIADATDPDRFNLCGQCHHSRGRTWQDSSRGPHHSVQSNMYTGEMPVPDGTEPIVATERTVHAFVSKQCATCHMRHEEFESEDLPAHTGHRFSISTAGCTATGCHPTADSAAADMETLQANVQADLDAIVARLGDAATWEYTAGGGPDADGQTAISDEIKQIRFLYYYVLGDASLGVHNPEYVRRILDKAGDLLTELGL